MLIKENVSPEWNKKSIVFVHGIGRQPEGFSEPLYQLLKKADGELADGSCWHEIAYDKVDTTIEQKVLQFQKALENSGSNALTSLGEDFVIDLVNFLSMVDTYHWITTIGRQVLVEVVEQGQQRGVQQREHEVYIISHSLGTVVAYELLHGIISDAQTLGLSKGFRIQTLFTLGCPIAFIKANQARIPSLNDKFFLRSGPIARPLAKNAFTGKTVSNISEWINLRQKFDPVASLTPLTPESSNGAIDSDHVFDQFHTGANPHDFANYLTEYGKLIMDAIRG